MDTMKVNPAHISEFKNGIKLEDGTTMTSIIPSNPPAGNNKKITNMWYNEDTRLPELKGALADPTATFEWLRSPKSLKASKDAIARVSPYGHDADAGDTGWGTADPNVTLEWLACGNQHRIRMDCEIKQVKLYTTPFTGTNSLTLRIWRKNGTVYDLVSESENLLDLMTPAEGVQTCDLTVPIVAEEGDYVGIKIMTGAAPNITQLKRSSTSGMTTYYTFTSVGSVGHDWEAETALANWTSVVELYADAPDVVIFGDSWASAYHSFAEATISPLTVTGLHALKGFTEAFDPVPTYQNMGVPGHRMGQLLARVGDFALLNPNYVIFLFGTNDGNRGITTEESWVAGWRELLNVCRKYDIIPIVCAIPPGTSRSKNSATTSAGAGDGTTVVSTVFDDSHADYYKDWQIEIGGEKRIIASYVVGSDTVTVTSAFSGQIGSGVDLFASFMPIRTVWMEKLAAVITTYPEAVLIDLDKEFGQWNSASEAQMSNLWDIKASVASGDEHLTGPGYVLLGAEIARQFKLYGRCDI